MSTPNGAQLGVLAVVVLKARHLPDKHTTRHKQSPYVRVELSQERECTPVVRKGGQHPVWDAELRFPVFEVPHAGNRLMRVEAWAQEGHKDDCLGATIVDVSETLRIGQFDDWIPLFLPSGIQRGEVYLEMTYFALRSPIRHSHPTITEPERQYSLPPLEQPSTIAFPHAEPLPPTRSSSLPVPHDMPNEPRRPRKLRKSMPLPPAVALTQVQSSTTNARHSVSSFPLSSSSDAPMTLGVIGAYPPVTPPASGSDTKQLPPTPRDNIAVSMTSTILDLGSSVASAAGEKITTTLSDDGTWSTSLKNVGQGAGAAMTSAVTNLFSWTQAAISKDKPEK
ncbi:C2 domain-containing protein [Flagelloscypha sp. PMI_526]|nr:C2 domain-containing protein [Flagelloscypha sp. PMI_526]